MKNPLAAIKGLSTHMARSATDPKTAERLAIVAAEADRLQAIVDGFLSFSRGLDDLNVAPTQPHEVARELARPARDARRGRGRDARGDGRRGRSCSTPTRASSARRCSTSCSTRSRRRRAGETVHDRGRARVRRGRRASRCIDDGAGMTPEVLDRIRKPYFTTKEGGTGLGVAVARGLVEQHGGQLEYESAPGQGDDGDHRPAR